MTSQLPLFASEGDRQLQAEIAWLRQRLDNAKTEFRALRDERDRYIRKLGEMEAQLENLGASWDQLEWTNRELRQDLASAEARVQTLRGLCDFYRLSASPEARQSQGPVVTRAALTHLLTLAHPDKWAQGQPATTLAHELTVAINRLREQAEVQP